MKNKNYTLNAILAAVVGIALLAIILTHTFLPGFIIPKLSIPSLALLSLIALVLDHYLARDARRCYICIPVFSAITFDLLPFCAGYIPAAEIWKLAIGGGAVFTIATFLFSSVQDRLSSGPARRAAPVISALGLYFAALGLAGVLL